MTGSVYNRGAGRGWAYQIYLGRDESGKQRRITKSGFKTRREAASALRREIIDLEEKAVLTAGPPRTLRQMLFAFIEDAAKRLAPKTIERYRHMAPYFDEALLNASISDITTLQLEREYWRLKERGGHKRKTGEARPLSKNSSAHGRPA